MRNPTTAAALVVIALVLFVLAVLYAVGAVNMFASGPGHHYKHAALLGILGILSLVAASFARRRQTAAY